MPPVGEMQTPPTVRDYATDDALYEQTDKSFLHERHGASSKNKNHARQASPPQNTTNKANSTGHCRYRCTYGYMVEYPANTPLQQ